MRVDLLAAIRLAAADKNAKRVSGLCGAAAHGKPERNKEEEVVTFHESGESESKERRV